MPISGLCPPSLSQRNFLTSLGTGTVNFPAPGPVFTETDFSVRCVIEVNLRNCSLDKCPNPPDFKVSNARLVQVRMSKSALPVETRNSAEPVDIYKELVHYFLLARIGQASIFMITLDVFSQELSSNGFRRYHIVVAVVTSPFREVICDVESCRRWSGILIVNELDVLGVVTA